MNMMRFSDSSSAPPPNFEILTKDIISLTSNLGSVLPAYKVVYTYTDEFLDVHKKMLVYFKKNNTTYVVNYNPEYDPFDTDTPLNTVEEIIDSIKIKEDAVRLVKSYTPISVPFLGISLRYPSGWNADNTTETLRIYSNKSGDLVIGQYDNTDFQILISATALETIR